MSVTTPQFGNLNQRAWRWLALLCVICFPLALHAAKPNDLEHIAIRYLDDINLGTWDGRSDMEGIEVFCVWVQNAEDGGAVKNGRYYVTASGDHRDGFALAGYNAAVPYEVYWSDKTNGNGGYRELEHGVTNSHRFKSSGSDNVCYNGARNNTRLKIRIAKSELEANKTAGELHGVLTLTVVVE